MGRGRAEEGEDPLRDRLGAGDKAFGAKLKVFTC